MKAKFILAVDACFSVRQPGRRWPARFVSAPETPRPTEHMAVAIWVLMGVVMSVLGGVGAFSFHLWRHANTPLEPHQELTEEDLEQYE